VNKSYKNWTRGKVLGEERLLKSTKRTYCHSCKSLLSMKYISLYSPNPYPIIIICFDSSNLKKHINFVMSNTTRTWLSLTFFLFSSAKVPTCMLFGKVFILITHLADQKLRFSKIRKYIGNKQLRIQHMICQLVKAFFVTHPFKAWFIFYYLRYLGKRDY
jgi:hypothetical protein